MARIYRTVFLFVVIAAVGAGPWIATADGRDVKRVGSNLADHVAGVSVADAPLLAAAPLTAYEKGLVEWAEGRFAEAGLELPELIVRFDPSGELCWPNEGLYQQTGDGEPIVTICTRESDSFAADLQRRRTLLHEFGHAWDLANLSDNDRRALGVLLGTDVWSGHDARWEDRGVERLAESFVYALLDQSRRQVKVPVECPTLVEAFRLATGAQPLGPGLPWCVDEPLAAGR